MDNPQNFFFFLIGKKILHQFWQESSMKLMDGVEDPPKSQDPFNNSCIQVQLYKPRSLHVSPPT